METAGRQTATPSAPRAAKGRSGRLVRERSWIAPLGCALACLVMALAGPQPARAQQQWPGSGNSTAGYPQQSGYPPLPQLSNADDGSAAPIDPLEALEFPADMPPVLPLDNSRLINDESCQTWTTAALNSPTVSVARLDVPGNASREYQRACSDFKGRKLASAEEHARGAVKIYPDYAAAWVILGEILQDEHKDNEAIQACRQGKVADPDYAPPYLCLAGFAARANDWDEAYTLSDRALSVDPATNPYAFLYTATADFHLKRMAQAELYGLSAERLDKWHHIPEVHLLLAKVYEAKGDPSGEERELRKFVKNAPHDSDWETAKTTLAKIEGQDAK
jgi:tetratricopeptide (TPR) repeat protein